MKQNVFIATIFFEKIRFPLLWIMELMYRFTRLRMCSYYKCLQQQLFTVKKISKKLATKLPLWRRLRKLSSHKCFPGSDLWSTWKSKVFLDCIQKAHIERIPCHGRNKKPLRGFFHNLLRYFFCQCLNCRYRNG